MSSRNFVLHDALRKDDDFVLGSAGMTSKKYEGWNFNSGNYLFTTDTK